VSAINFHTKEISVKIVFYGAGLCGKTTSLHTIYASLPEHKRPQLVSLATEGDRTIFFDFLPVTAYRIKDFNVRLQLYTVPGQVFYNATRKLVLNGVDGVVFVVDSQRMMRDSNAESLQNLHENLAELGLEIAQVPMVMQFNKRDLGDTFAMDEMEQLYNPRHIPAFATVATTGSGVFEALKSISQQVVNDLLRKGLGRQIREQTGPVGIKEPDGFAAVGDAVREAAKAVPAPASLWPPGAALAVGTRIDAARAAGRWNEMVVAIDELITAEVKRMASSAADKGYDSVPALLLLRNVHGARYAALMRAVQGAKQGRSVSQNEAMSALITALELFW
jgi:signal recognition particle receptor subunit beta